MTTKAWFTLAFIIGWPSYWAFVFSVLEYDKLRWAVVLPIFSAIVTFIFPWIFLTHPAYNPKPEKADDTPRDDLPRL